MAMPVFVRDFTDFSSSKVHARNMGAMFRGSDNDLYPNYVHLPIAYHSRASSIVLDGTPVTRPQGQISDDGKTPEWKISRQVDFELEIGTIIGKENKMGRPIKINDANEHVFGYTLLNDWSSRDIMKWEILPLGCFNGKNFATTISPWVITPEALEPFKTNMEPQSDPELLPYLQGADQHLYDINLGVDIKS